MTVVICLLRGVNVGGHHKIKMDGLRGICESLGLEDPQTCLQSGNVVFRTPEGNVKGLEARIENAIELNRGFRPAVIFRTCAELQDAVASNPFAGRGGLDPARLATLFLAREPTAEVCARLLGIEVDPEELRIRGREVYAYYPNGMGRSKLQPALIERTLAVQGTARNWNTVLKLLEIAERLQTAR